MYKLTGIYLLLCFAFLAGCTTAPDITIYSHTEVITTSSRADSAFPRGTPVFACKSVDAVYSYVDNNVLEQIDGQNVCFNSNMTLAIPRSTYDSALYGRVTIYQFMLPNGGTYYTYRGGSLYQPPKSPDQSVVKWCFNRFVHDFAKYQKCIKQNS